MTFKDIFVNKHKNSFITYKMQAQSDMLGTLDQCGERSQYHNLVDVLFVIDATGSMGWCVDQMTDTIKKIVKRFSDKQYNIKFAIQLYRDHPPQQYSFIEQHYDLRSEKNIMKVIEEQCDVVGGGDIPEAVFDGLVNGLEKTSWRVSTDGKKKSKRFLFHGCDAPPHGKQYGYDSEVNQWTESGCPCNLNRLDVKRLLDEKNVDYSLIKCGGQVDLMSALFQECFADKFRREIQIKKEVVSKPIKEPTQHMKAISRPKYAYKKQKIEHWDQQQDICCMGDEVADEMEAGLFGFFD